MKMFTYYRPGCVEALRDLDYGCQQNGHTLRLLTPRSALGTRLSRKFTGPDWMLALHAAGGGWFHDITTRQTARYSKNRIEGLLKDAAQYSRTATR
jgi:hypothetical protein